MKKIVLGLSMAAAALLTITSLALSGATKDEFITLSKDNVISLMDEVNGDTVAGVIMQTKKITKKSILDKTLGKVIDNKKPIFFVLYTPGGEIQSGLELKEFLKGIDRPIHVITIFAASMGFQLSQSFGDRFIVDTGVLMSHYAMGRFSGEFGGQKPNQIDNRKRIWEQRILELDEQTVKRTKGKQTLASYQAAYVKELWLTGKESVEQGYADKIVTVRCDDTLSGTTKHHINLFGIIKIDYELDMCPLNTNIMNVKVTIKTTKGDKPLNEFLANGGGFGTSCYQLMGTDKNQVCALDTTITLEKINSLVNDFKDKFVNIQNHVIPMRY